MKDLEKIKEFFLKDRAMTAAYEAKEEYFKPVVRKDKSFPNFLYVDIAYPSGPGFTTALGSKTMSGQESEAGAVKALSMGNDIAKKLEAKYNIEDIEVKDLKNGKVQVFAVSDDFTEMSTPSLNENFPGPGEIVDAKYLNNDMLDYFYRTNKKLLINTKTKKGIKGGVGTFYGDLVFGGGGDFIKLKDIVSVEIVESSMNEAKKEDKVDTITMDVPLFIRMLEYSKEDAAKDMDLHDVTEKAIVLGKERGILQMDDYDEIVGTTKEIKEASSFAQQAAIAISKKKSGNYDKEGKRIKETSDPQSGKAAPYGSGYKPLEERISEALDKINEELCPAGKAYRKRRMAAGEKSSAYLSGRAVKVCKGQMSGKKKKK